MILLRVMQGNISTTPPLLFGLKAFANSLVANQPDDRKTGQFAKDIRAGVLALETALGELHELSSRIPTPDTKEVTARQDQILEGVGKAFSKIGQNFIRVLANFRKAVGTDLANLKLSEFISKLKNESSELALSFNERASQCYGLIREFLPPSLDGKIADEILIHKLVAEADLGQEGGPKVAEFVRSLKSLSRSAGNSTLYRYVAEALERNKASIT